VIRVTREALRRGLETLLHTHDTPRRTALAYALGVFWGFSPPLGLHTVLGLTCAFALGLNRVAVVLGIYSNLPWIIVPYYMLATFVGAAILGVDLPPGLVKELKELLENFSIQEANRLAGHLAPLLWSYVLGSTIGALIAAGVAYRAARVFITAHRRRLERSKQNPPISGI
jgi:uncharacterized protein